MKTQEERDAGSWECLRIGCRLFVVTLAVVALAAACAALMGCSGIRSGFSGRGRPYGRVGVGTPARHTIEHRLGLGYEWEGGAEVELNYRPWDRVDEPSTRGFPREVGRVYLDAKIPFGP